MRTFLSVIQIIFCLAAAVALGWAAFEDSGEMFLPFFMILWMPGCLILIAIYSVLEWLVKKIEKKRLNKEIEREIKRSEEFHRLHGTKP